MGLLDHIITVCLTLQETAFHDVFPKWPCHFAFLQQFFNVGPFACLAITPLTSFSLPTYTLSFSLATAFFGKDSSDPRSGFIHLLCSVTLLYVYISPISVA